MSSFPVRAVAGEAIVRRQDPEPVVLRPRTTTRDPPPRAKRPSGTSVYVRAAVAPAYAWIVMAHALGGALIGALEAMRLGNLRIGLAIVPMFAATGLLAGIACALVERLVVKRAAWIAVLAIAAPTLAVTIPVCATLFDGAYAQT